MTPGELSVVMPVRNAMPYLADSVASILAQTHSDFEFVILDDASTDGSHEFLRELAARDRRVRLERSERHLGSVGAANRVVELASSPLHARMDADDACEPDRLERQLAVLAGAPDAVLVGHLADGIDASGRRVRGRDRWRLLRRSAFPPIPHASIMYRREDFLACGGYREEAGSWHDADLILRMATRGRILVLPEALHHFRYNTGSVTLTRADREAIREADLMWRCFAELERSGSYDELLLPGAGNGRPASVDAAAWVGRYRDAMLLWAGRPPADSLPAGALPWRLRRTWHRRHPSSLRAALRLAVAARDRVAGLAVRDGRVREWRYG